MNSHTTAALLGFGFWLLPLAAPAQTPVPPLPLRYHFTPGQRLRYLIMRDPYFANPAAAMETTNPNSPYRPPIVERLTEEVLSVQSDGTATLKVTVGSEPDFEEDAHPVAPITQTLTVTPLGQVISPSPPPGFLRAFFRLPPDPTPAWKGVAFRGSEPVGTSLTLTDLRGGLRGLAIITQTLPPSVSRRTSPDHDGTLLQTTHAAQSDHLVFDMGAGNLLRQTSTLTVDMSLVMTNRGARGVADFGHVVPNVEVIQTMTIERKEDLPSASADAPSPALTARQSKN